MDLAELMNDILDRACPNGGANNMFYIETHCVGWRVTAEKLDGQWHILGTTSEDC